jgi:DNA-binding GntR family transcriptional regulator
MAADKRDTRKIQLAQQVLQLASQAGWDKGRHLKEVDLSEALGVSRSPIRGALSLLEQWGVALRRPNQGFFLDRNADELLAFGNEVPKTPEDELYIAIIDARIERKLSEIFTQVQIMNAFAAQRSVVERVLWQMSDEGLIEKLKGRGWQFLPSFDDFLSWDKGYQFRIIVEPAAILVPGFEVDNEKLTVCRLAHQDLMSAVNAGRDIAMWIYETDSNFHELIVSFSRNGFFTQAVQNQNRLRRLMEYRGYSNRRRIIDWCNEHLSIINALERSQFERASSLMRDHLKNASNITPTAVSLGRHSER